MNFLLLTIVALMFVLYYALLLEHMSYRRRYYQRDLSHIADSRYCCKLLAEALEIEAPGEKVEQYVSWAIKERLNKEAKS